MLASIYQPLDLTKKEIRLLRIRGNLLSKAPLACILETYSLQSGVVFEALSYAWGDTSVRKAVSINRQKLKITASLESALQYLRTRDHRRKLFWVDALCINQSDVNERNHQVRLMRQIYSSAICVRIWLGAGNVRTDFAIETLRTLQMDESIVSLHSNARGLSPADPSVYFDLFERSWWQRLWVIQEPILAKAAVIHCGRASISFDMFMRSCRKLRDDLASDHKWFTNHNNLETLRLNHFWGSTFRRMDVALNCHHSTFSSPSQCIRVACLLAECRLAECADARDKVYAILSLMPEDFGTSIYPDYEASVTDIYRNFFIKFTQHYQSLVLFNLAFTNDQGNASLPSWVPDWSCTSVLPVMPHIADINMVTSIAIVRASVIELYNACGDYPIKFEQPCETVLWLKGLKVDTVEKKGDQLGSKGESPLKARSFFDAHVSSISQAYDDVEDVWWRTLTNDIDNRDYFDANSVSFRVPRRCVSGDYTRFAEWWKMLPNHREDDFVNADVQRALIGRHMVISSQGYVGTGPANIEVGDVLFILAGGRMVYALRPVTSVPGEGASSLFASNPNVFYRLVGDCYVHGIMDGQFVESKMQGRKPESGYEGWEDVYLV